MVIGLEIETWVISKDGTTREGEKGGVGEEVWRLLCFVTLMYARVYFCYCIGWCLSQGLQGAGGIHSWYSRLVSW
jgi:hypothetical protein